MIATANLPLLLTRVGKGITTTGELGSHFFLEETYHNSFYTAVLLDY